MLLSYIKPSDCRHLTSGSGKGLNDRARLMRHFQCSFNGCVSRFEAQCTDFHSMIIPKAHSEAYSGVVFGTELELRLLFVCPDLAEFLG